MLFLQIEGSESKIGMDGILMYQYVHKKNQFCLILACLLFPFIQLGFLMSIVANIACPVSECLSESVNLFLVRIR